MTRWLAAFLSIAICGAAEPAASQPASINLAGCKGSYSRDRVTRRPVQPDCQKEGFQAEMLNGVVAPDERHTAAIIFKRTKDGKREICTGVLVDSLHVLTAGHCGCGIPDSYSVSFETSPVDGAVVRNASKIEGRPILFDPGTCILGPRPGADLALLKLPKDILGIQLKKYGYPAFATVNDLREQLLPGTPLKVVGFGETETGSTAVRMKASIPVLTSECLGRPYNSACAPFAEMILADAAGARRRDSCRGDSGGPVFAEMTVEMDNCDTRSAQKKVRAKVQTLVAITSRAAPFTQPLRAQHCGGGGIYTLIGRVTVHSWLDHNNVRKQQCLNSEEE